MPSPFQNFKFCRRFDSRARRTMFIYISSLCLWPVEISCCNLSCLKLLHCFTGPENIPDNHRLKPVNQYLSLFHARHTDFPFFLLPFVLIAKATAAFPASIFPSLVDTLIRRLLIQASFLVDVIPAFFRRKEGKKLRRIRSLANNCFAFCLRLVNCRKYLFSILLN